MTPAEWTEATDPRPMLRSLPEGEFRRELVLFACGCCDRLGCLLSDPRSVSSLEVVRRAADGRADSPEIDTAVRVADLAAQEAIWAFCTSLFGAEERRTRRRQLSSGPDPFEMMAAADPASNAARAVAWAAGSLSDPALADLVARCAARAVAGTSCDMTAWAVERRAQADLLRTLISPRLDTSSI